MDGTLGVILGDRKNFRAKINNRKKINRIYGAPEFNHGSENLGKRAISKFYKRQNYHYGRYDHCAPEGRGNLVLAWDCFLAPLLAMTLYIFRLF